MAPAPDLPPKHRCPMTAAQFRVGGRSPISASWPHHRGRFRRESTPRDQPMNSGFALTAYENRRLVGSRVRRPRSIVTTSMLQAQTMASSRGWRL
jgi:hypothetical protein